MKPDAYEQFVGKLISLLGENDLINKPSIQQRRKITGRTGQVYEIDLSYTFSVAEADYLTAIECKCWRHRVGRNIVSAFKTVTDDIGAHKGIVVTTQGFQSGAIEAAGSYGIALMKVSTKGHLEVIQHLHGEDERAKEDLRSAGEYEASQPLSHITGVAPMSTHIIDYVAMRYGEEVAAFLNTEEAISTSQIADPEIRKKVEQQLKSMGEKWIYQYLELETCGMPIVIEPSIYLRRINMKAFINMMQLGYVDR